MLDCPRLHENDAYSDDRREKVVTQEKQRTCNQGAETRSCIVGHPKIV
jgi:hypothetical protein